MPSTKEKASRWEEQEESFHQEFSHLHQSQPEEQKQKHHLCDKKEEQRQSGCSQGWEEWKELEPLHLGAQGSHHQYEGASNGVTWRLKIDSGGFGGLSNKKMMVHYQALRKRDLYGGVTSLNFWTLLKVWQWLTSVMEQAVSSGMTFGWIMSQNKFSLRPCLVPKIFQDYPSH